MEKKYISYKHDRFEDIGLELFKLATTLSYADKTNRTFILNNDDYMNIIDLFIKISYDNSKEIFEIKDDFNYYIDYYDKKISIDFTNYRFNHFQISSKIKVLLSLLITGNSNYTNFVYSRINDFMNYFKDYSLSNYVCMNIKRDTYVSYYYEKAYYRNFNNKKLIIRADDLDWARTNINFIDKSKIIFIEANHENKFTDFILLSLFQNYIIDYDYYSWWIAYISNPNSENKKVIVPNNNHDFYLPEWIRQS